MYSVWQIGFVISLQLGDGWISDFFALSMKAGVLIVFFQACQLAGLTQSDYTMSLFLAKQTTLV